MTPSETCRSTREALGLTQQELADRLLVSRAYLAQVETGTKIPSARLLAQITALVPSKSDEVNTVQEAGPPEYGTAAAIAQQIRERFERLMTAAAGNTQRLGWVAEQLQRHLGEPEHWFTAEELAERESARQARIAAMRATMPKLRRDLPPAPPQTGKAD